MVAGGAVSTSGSPPRPPRLDLGCDSERGLRQRLRAAWWCRRMRTRAAAAGELTRSRAFGAALLSSPPLDRSRPAAAAVIRYPHDAGDHRRRHGGVAGFLGALVVAEQPTPPPSPHRSSHFRQELARGIPGAASLVSSRRRRSSVRFVERSISALITSVGGRPARKLRCALQC